MKLRLIKPGLVGVNGVLDLDLRNMASGRVILYRLKPWIFYKVFKYNRSSLDQPTLFDFV